MPETTIGAPMKSRFETGIAWFEMVVVLGAATWVAYRLYLGVQAGWGYTTDDAWIPLRYARNLLEGEGITWNAGEVPVEGYSSFSFVLLGAAALALKVHPIIAYKSVCVASAIASLIGLYALARQWTRPLFAVLPSMALVSYYGYNYWITAGLETSFYIFCYISATLAMTIALRALQIGEVSTSDSLAATSWTVCAGLLIFVASVTRPEGPIVGITLGIPILLAATTHRFCKQDPLQGRRDARKLMRAFIILAASAAIPFAIYFSWRYLAFERIFANTVYCKAWWGGDPLKLIKSFAAIAAFPAIVALMRRPRSLQFRDLFLLLPTFAYVYLTYGANPLIAQYNRLVLAAYSLLLVAATISVSDMSKLVSSRAFSAFIGMAAIGAIMYSAMPAEEMARSLELHGKRYAKGQENRMKTVEWVNSQLGPGDTWAIGDVGLVGFYSIPKVMDVYCLNNAAMTSEGRRQSGIETAELVMSEKPEILALSTSKYKELYPISIWNNVLEREEFDDQYEHVKIFGFNGNGHNYWMYRRKDPQ